jgi:DASS family divalent anion:Na+ symporter
MAMYTCFSKAYDVFYVGMAANPIVVAKANQLFPDLNFGFMTWLKGSIVPAIVCALCIPIFIRWSLGLNFDKPSRGKHAREAHNVIQHAQMELDKMGPVSAKEWVMIYMQAVSASSQQSTYIN